jgi:hypothetical protein
MKKLLFLCFLGLPAIGFSQGKPIPIRISVFDESTAIPFTKLITTPVHPGVQIGTEFNLKTTAHARFFQTVNLNYFYHSQLNHGIGFLTEFGYEYATNFGLKCSGLLGIGYLHTIATTKEYVFENGAYVPANDFGNARFTPSFAIDLAYPISESAACKPELFVRYQSWAEIPYSPGFIPVMSHINFHIGTKFLIQNNKK